jgi:hypothetical protein
MNDPLKRRGASCSYGEKTNDKRQCQQQLSFGVKAER